jgi:SAM-dependent methyltransferase
LLPEFFGDQEFDCAYSAQIRRLSGCHWTPVNVSREAAQFLVTNSSTRVLDVGCGPGKFCAVGAITTAGEFIGVEQRAHLVSAAKGMLKLHHVRRVQILHANVTAIDFGGFDAFYLFNPFHENLLPGKSIDAQVELAPSLYDTYSEYVRAGLSMTPAGTRAVTYCGDHDEIPHSFSQVKSDFGGRLKFWVKK